MRYRKMTAPFAVLVTALAAWALSGAAMGADTPEGGGGHPVLPEIGEPLSPLGKDWKPPLRPASDAGEKAMAKFDFPKDLQVKLWAAEPMLANPNAISVDEHGKIYVAETYRYHGGVLDIRGYLSGPKAMLEPDIASRSVEERVAFVRRVLGKDADKLAIDQDRVVLLQDSTGSGKADTSSIFTDGYNRIEDGLGSGVLARKGELYYTCIPSLYALRDTNGDGKADTRKVLSTGYGVRYAYLGHDLHGLIFGPDGKLYYSIGDRAANATAVDGSRAENTESGSVFRCNPDGTELEIFATGLRNPQELAFDQYGNLFTGDNNPDKGDPARWVYVCEGSDNGWRVGYQHGEKPRDGGPWMAEQIWQSAEHSNANYIVPCVAPLGAGPSGLAYYPGTGMPDRYNNAFFLCDFRGGSGNSGIWAIKNTPKGAGFELTSIDGKPVDKNSLAQNHLMYHLLCVDLAFGPDSAIYIADWTEGWERPMAGRIYKMFDPEKANTPAVEEVKKLIGEGFDKRPVEELTKLLGHADQRVRLEAQYAIAAKGASTIAALTPVATAGPSVVARLHAIWGLGQIARADAKANALAGVLPLLGDKELQIRCQAAQMLGDRRIAAAYEPLLKLAQDPEPRARYFAAMALGKLGNTQAVSALLNVLKENADQDAVLRHGCVAALAALKDEAALVGAAKDASPSVRLGAALALRRTASPAITAYLKDADRIVVLEAARAINDLPIVEALPALAALVDQPISATKGFAEKPAGPGPGVTGDAAEWVLWRAMNANFRLGTPEAAGRLAAVAGRADVPSAIRVEALRDLGAWDKPENRDRITNLWRPLLVRDAKLAKDAAAPVVEKIARTAPNEVRVAATNLMRKLGLGDAAFLLSTLSDIKSSPEVRIAALSSLAGGKNDKLADGLKIALKDPAEPVRVAAIQTQAALPEGIKTVQGLLDTGSVHEKQAVLTGLGAAPAGEADAILGQWLDKLSAKQVPAELELDLTDAAGHRQAAAVKEKLAKFTATLDAKDPLGEFRGALSGGNAAAGYQIFRERADVSCIRCHTVKGEGGIVGPVLDGIGARQNREYLVESIVAPNAKIAPGFESVIVKLKKGGFRTGVLRSENDKEIVLVNPDNQENPVLTVPKAEIDTRERGPSAMPEGLHKALTKRELRDVVEFLAELK